MRREIHELYLIRIVAVDQYVLSSIDQSVARRHFSQDFSGAPPGSATYPTLLTDS